MASMNYGKIQEYLLGLVPPRPNEMLKMERLAKRTNFPIIGPAAGYYCYQVARHIGARSVFELGSGFGYSTAWFARAVRENGGGVVHHTVWDAELSERARDHLGRMGLGGTVEYHVGEAVTTLAAQARSFDLIFMDIDKPQYPGALPTIKARLRRGGVLITDNLLWSGQIFDARDRSAGTRGIRTFTKAVMSDPDWIATILPIRDGLLVATLMTS
jgi:caffeoyl-CoA O-methyltransferase